jgi:hypothetical protein
MKIIRWALGGIALFCIVFTAVFGYKQINKNSFVLEQKEYKGVLSLWHIDTFEGGKGSRKAYLLKVARDYEKTFNGVLIMVVSHTPESVIKAYEQGENPDMISFGLGVKVNAPSQLSKKYISSGGVINNKVYANVWCRGGYLLISKKDEKVDLQSKQIQTLVVSSTTYNQPLTALALQGYTANNIMSFDPLDAYVEFLSKKGSVLLGTQRDVIRLENRGVECDTIELSEFNDLYQYISVTSKQQEKIDYSKKFIDLLMSEKHQKNLSSIGMFSDFYKVSYQNEHMIKIQNKKASLTFSGFTDANTLLNLKDISLKAVKGDEESLKKLKKMPFLP